MEITIGINNTVGGGVDGKLVEKAARAVLEREAGADKSGVEVSIAFVEAERIRELNRIYRQKDAVTDVLSFAEAESPDFPCPENGNVGYLGEIVVCFEQVVADAKESGIAVSQELAWVVIHGILHLLGYDHEAGEERAAVMRQKEKQYLQLAGVSYFELRN